MLKLDSVAAFTAIAEAGSISGAARRLALSKSVVSERLKELEHVLRVKLVHRTTRGLSLTDDGNAFQVRAMRILREVDGAVSELAERRGTLAGPLRISAPVSFGTLHLGPALFGFLARHPEIELTLELDDRFVNMLAEGYDAVIRHGPVDEERIIVKRLAASRRLLVAAPEYLKRRGKPVTLTDLEQHDGIIYSNRGAGDWRFKTGRTFTTVRPRARLYVNNGLIMRDAAIDGLGIALLATFLLEGPLKKRSLQVIDVDAEAERATVYIAYPEHQRLSGKIRALTNCLQKSFGDPAYWDAALASKL
jgi:DNA-binding transcriptional LysR family regulator